MKGYLQKTTPEKRRKKKLGKKGESDGSKQRGSIWKFGTTPHAMEAGKNKKKPHCRC